MRISYDLSDRQRDALNKGEKLTLAIPLDPEGDKAISGGERDDVEEWLRQKLPTLGGFYIQFKGVLPIIVDPVINPVGSDLSKRFGTILQNDLGYTGFVMDVATIEVTNPDRPQSGESKVQWPGGALCLNHDS